MPPTPRKRVILDLIDNAWSNGHLDALPMYWTDECVDHPDTEGDNVGLALPRTYHESFQAGFTDFSDVEIRVLRQTDEGDTAVTRMLTSATHLGLSKNVTLDTIRIDRLRELKIAEHWSVADMAGLLEELQEERFLRLAERMSLNRWGG